MLYAGHKTAGNNKIYKKNRQKFIARALISVVECLAKNIQVQDKLLSEVGDCSFADLTFEKIESLQYLDATIRETLRLYPLGAE